jgi:hypothetical protein
MGIFHQPPILMILRQAPSSEIIYPALGDEKENSFSRPQGIKLQVFWSLIGIILGKGFIGVKGN